VKPPVVLKTKHVKAIPGMHTECGRGFGIAACPVLGVVVTSSSSSNSLKVYALPGSALNSELENAVETLTGMLETSTTKGLKLLYEFGGPLNEPFAFSGTERFHGTGYLAFASPRRLLITDTVQHAVHIFDVVDIRHMGYVAEPGGSMLLNPRGVAAHGDLVAVSSWPATRSWVSSWPWGEIVLLQGSWCGTREWTKLRVFRNRMMQRPCGLRFNEAGTSLVVAVLAPDAAVLTVSVKSGSIFNNGVCVGLTEPCDVQRVAGFLLVSNADGGGGVHQVRGNAGADRLIAAKDLRGGWFSWPMPTCLAVLPGFGLVVRTSDSFGGGSFDVFTTADVIAMDTVMSIFRVAWMASVYRSPWHFKAQ
jgi:hypothetical protein